MKVSKETIENKIETIDKNLTYLEGEKEKFKPETATFKDIQAIKYSLLEIVESCIDITSHIIAAEGFQRPSEYSQMFKILAKHEILSHDLASNLSEMAKFRNFLVHRYDKIQDERLETILNEDLQDIRNFIEEIYNYTGL